MKHRDGICIHFSLGRWPLSCEKRAQSKLVYAVIEPNIQFYRHPYDDSSWHVVLHASNGTHSALQEFYAYPEDLDDLGKRLIDFPQQPQNEVRFEIGSRTENWAYYVLLRAFLYDSVGHTALEFAADNRRCMPYHSQASFFIFCEVASVNRLGEQLRSWIANTQEPIIWTNRYA